MKSWIVQHKFYLVAGVLLVLGSVYYFYGYQPVPSREQDITGLQNNPPPIETSENEKEKEIKQNNQISKEEIFIVDVKGEVKLPGVYHSNVNERVIDVIGRAGGLTEKADKSQVNLAAHVQDEMVIYIPAIGEGESSSAVISTVSSSDKNDLGTNKGKININKADETELQTLPGIGPAKATSIIQYRQENGQFQSIEDLKKISGIGEKTFEKLKESISVQ